ncbi:TonB-dependent receptor, partial [Parabacteroides goldsteinii]
MNKIITLILCLCCVFTTAWADDAPALNPSDANIVGHILDKKTGEHLSFINVFLKGTTIGTSTDATGHYYLKNLPEGKYTLVMKTLGFKTVEKPITLKKGKTLEINFEAEEDLVSLDGVVVSANRNETTRRLAPSLVNVLDSKTFETTHATSLADGLNFQPGVRVENNCQNCGFQQVRINGLEGPYTQILVDSRPIFSALTGVYGLEQIPANMIERVEIMRGGGSALFGSSAIAGTINIITKEPLRNSAQISHSLTMIGGDRPDNNTTINASLVTDDHKAGIYMFGQNR